MPVNITDRLIPAHAGKTCSTRQNWRPPGAHPRSRGENTAQFSVLLEEGGSSPLTRGKLIPRACIPGVPGLIPAHAGKTPRRHGRRATPPAHPRSRGENLGSAGFDPCGEGSSPLTRGKHHEPPWRRRRQRLIPAHAGKTSVHPLVVACPAAHPRSRGENEVALFALLDERGSSPLTRGKRRNNLRLLRVSRLIPAHAGKTDGGSRPGPVFSAHPRSRGENSPCGMCRLRRLGSSPLTRGKRFADAYDRLGNGLIPAHAGKTTSIWSPPLYGRAHPRSRGENTVPSPAVPPAVGSSPLTRGKPCHRVMGVAGWGLIPAHAGKTAADPFNMAVLQAHPRSRGENNTCRCVSHDTTGSSPLTRGKPVVETEGLALARLIPAHAGKTYPS